MSSAVCPRGSKLVRIVAIGGLGLLAWLASAAAAPRARACSCAAPPLPMLTITPAAGSVAPRNTRIWMLRPDGVEPGQILGLTLRDESGAVIDTQPSAFILGPRGGATLVVLEPLTELPANASFSVEVVGESDALVRQRVFFRTNELVDEEPPEPPIAVDVRNTPAEPGSSCGPQPSISVDLSGDVWIVKRSEEPSAAEGPGPHPDVPGSSIDSMFLDTPGGELASGPCGQTFPSPTGSMQLGTFDLAGNFSGWGERMRFDQPVIDASPCSVSAVGESGRDGWPLAWLVALGLGLGLAALRWRTRAPASRCERRAHDAHK